jgi:hypothetical protein
MISLLELHRLLLYTIHEGIICENRNMESIAKRWKIRKYDFSKITGDRMRNPCYNS